MSARWVDAGALADFDAGRRALQVDGLHIGIFVVGAEAFALDDICTHGNARLSDGDIDGCMIECPLHAGLVDLRTGKAAGAPIIRDTRTYPTKVVDGRVLVELP
jgi:nitrite reductase/ring-hydroxylating ferredoxin subunit